MPQGVVFVPSFMLVRPKIVLAYVGLATVLLGDLIVWRIGGKAALLIHFKSKHSDFIDFNTKIYQCYEVIFLQEPPVDKLDYFESIRVSNLDAKINIAKTSLPKIK